MPHLMHIHMPLPARPHLLPVLIFLALVLVGCIAPSTPSATPVGTTTAPVRSEHPTLDDFWEGRAHFVMNVEDTGLPMGESDTIVLDDGTWRSYVHASHQSLGVFDQCGAPVEFPGCLVIFNSSDHGRTFAPTRDANGMPICQIACSRCPCDSQRDHIDQQQYPRVAHVKTTHGEASWLLTYEYRANTILRRSTDGLTWSSPSELPLTGIWRTWLMPCSAVASVGLHPNTPTMFDCLVGSPPGIYIDDAATPPELYVFVGLGQNPSGLGCYRGSLHGPASLLRACDHNPLFVGAASYGPTDETSRQSTSRQSTSRQSTSGQTANAHFDFRTISSADVITVGEHRYIFYEGVRGPRAGDAGDTQFLLGLARSTTPALDGTWELYPQNPILLDLPGNVGVGHADVVIDAGTTYLYTSLDGAIRSRLRLAWE